MNRALKRGETVPYNLAQAGAAVGKSKATILRAIRRGTISAGRNAVTGGWEIEPVELHRAFQPVADETSHNRVKTAEMRELRARAEAEGLPGEDRGCCK